MKKLMTAIGLALIAGSVFAALDVYDSVTVKSLGEPKMCTGIQTNIWVDVSGAKGICNLLVNIGPAYTNALDFGASATLKTSATTNGSYVAVTNVSGAGITGTGAVTSIKLDASSLSRYVRLFTVSTNDAASIGAFLLYSK